MTDATGVLTTAAEGLAATPASPARLAWRRFRRHRLAMASAVVLVLFGVLVFFPGLVTDYGAAERDLSADQYAGPTGDHPLGTDNLRRDMLSRVLHGGQVSLQIGLSVALVSAVIGALVGALSGYRGGWVDNALMRVTDLFLAIPLLVALIVLTRLPERHDWAEALMGSRGSVRSVVTIIALFLWMPIARIVRGVVLSLKEKEFVEAARALGASDARILFRSLLPNCVGPIVVAVTLSVAAAILTESALSFLGYGVESATSPTWGSLLANTKSQLRNHGHIVWFPGLAIVVTVLCVNYLGDGLRDALDPRQTRHR
ncbi:MAG: ABC transporter permease [Acidimicrobiia bacterium]